MIKYIMSRKLYDRVLIGIGFCVVVFVLGYFLLNHISTMEDPPLGNTVYILVGSAFLFCSVLGVVVILKYLYDNKKKQVRRERKREKHKIFFLEDIEKKKKTD